MSGDRGPDLNARGWPPRPAPVACLICGVYKDVWSILRAPDEIDIELVCGHRVLTTTRKRGSHGVA